MSHTLRKVTLGNSALVESTVIDYVAPGESYTLAELGITGGVQSIVFLLPASFYEQSGIIPKLANNQVVLETGPGVPLPTTTGVNFTFVAIVNGT